MKKILIAVFWSLLPLAAAAQNGTLVDVSVVSRASGQTVPTWIHQGRTYVAGETGERYFIVLTNRTAARVLVVVSVDGVNVITGETASPAQSGYVLDPRGRLEIGGWRKNMGEVAAFYFTPQPDSYAARTDRPGNVGVIGVAAFREFQPRVPPYQPGHVPYAAPPSAAFGEALDRQGAGSARESAGAPVEAFQIPGRRERLGTGHGEREASAARWTQFRRASESPNELMTIYYDTRANLAARGIIPGAALRRPVDPNPFPHFSFAPDPRS